MSGFDTSDFNVPPVGNPRGIFIFRTFILFDIESQRLLGFLLSLTDFIDPLKI